MSTRPFVRITSADEVRRTADALGSYYFSPDTMQFFNSRLLNAFEPVTPITRDADGNIEPVDTEVAYIVTSERHGDEPRHYATRRVVVTRDEDGRDQIDIARIDVHATAAEAKKLARILASGERSANLKNGKGEQR